MKLKHKVSISVTQPNGTKAPVLKSGKMQIHKRFLDFLFGEKVNVLVLTPGDSVECVSITELPDGGDIADGK
jgi:hypothetical protein